MKTKYLDTNLVLRLIIQDNLEQLECIYGLFEDCNNKKFKLFCSEVVIFECEWVLRSFYKFTKTDITTILQKVLLIQEINFENSEILNLTIQKMLTNNLGIEDNYHLSFCQNKNMELVTFDQKLQKTLESEIKLNL